MMTRPFWNLYFFLILALASVGAQFEIGTPAISYNGLVLKLQYNVANGRSPGNSRVRYFIDENCERELQWNQPTPFFTTDIYNGNGNGDGTKTMVVDVSMDVQQVSQSQIVNKLRGETYIVFAVRFSVLDPTTQQEQNSNCQIIRIGIDLTNDIGITGFLEDVEETFKVDSFFCDEDLNPVRQVGALIQGTKVRVCVTPDSNTRSYGVLVNRIDNFFLSKDTSEGVISRPIIGEFGRVEDPRATDLSCREATEVCSFTTIPSNEFFREDGTVFGAGTVAFMYNYDVGLRRRAIRAPIETGHRSLANLGGFNAGFKDFRVSFDVAPADPIYQSRAFRCDALNQPLSEEALSTPLYEGDFVRVCFAPDDLALLKGVYMNQVESFSFVQQDQHSQVAVSNGIASQGTMLLCEAGDTMCALKTYLEKDFFRKAVTIEARGEIHQQFGTERLSIFRRRLNDEWDPGYAGTSIISFSISISLASPPDGSDRGIIDDIQNWWNNTPLAWRVLYIICFVIILLLILMGFCLLLFGLPSIFKKKKSLDDDDDHIFLPPNAFPSTHNDKVDFCECLSDADGFEFEPNYEYVPKGSRSVPSPSNGEQWPPREFAEEKAPAKEPSSPPKERLPELEYGKDLDPAAMPPKSPKTPKRAKKAKTAESPQSAPGRAKRRDSTKKAASARNFKEGDEQEQSSFRSPRPGRKKRDPSLNDPSSFHDQQSPAGRSPRAGKRDPTLLDPSYHSEQSTPRSGRKLNHSRRTLETPSSHSQQSTPRSGRKLDHSRRTLETPSSHSQQSTPRSGRNSNHSRKSVETPSRRTPRSGRKKPNSTSKLQAPTDVPFAADFD